MNKWTSFTNNEDESYKENSAGNYVIDSANIVWEMTSEQICYYVQQFKKIVPPHCQKLPGSLAKEFFELSKLSIDDLRNIWELADQDKDGFLKLGEFCVAMHLVVLKKNGLIIPRLLPLELVPYLNLTYTNEVDAMNSKPPDKKLPIDSKKAMYSKLLKRLPSDSSLKSDALSLTDGMTAFTSKPPEGDKITYPVPFKPPISQNDVTLSTILKPEGPKQLLIEGENYNLEANTTVEIKNEPDITIKTPPVPPRHRWTQKPVDNSNSYSNFQEDAPANEPLLDENYLVCNSAYGIDFTQSPVAIVMSLNSIFDSDERKEAYNYVISTTKMQCESLTSLNEEMSRNLKQLQQQRISLEIQLEKMMPLKYAS